MIMRLAKRGDVQRVDDTYDHRYDAPVRLVEGGAGGVALSVHQHGVTDPCLGIVQSDEVPLRRGAGQRQRLHDQQTPVLVIRVADGCNHRSDNFSNGHIRLFVFSKQALLMLRYVYFI